MGDKDATPDYAARGVTPHNNFSGSPDDLGQGKQNGKDTAVLILQGDGPEIGRIVAANQAAALRQGVSVEQMTRMHIDQLRIPKAVEHASRSIGRMLADNNTHFKIDLNGTGQEGLSLEVSPGQVQVCADGYLITFDREFSQRQDSAERLRRNYLNQVMLNALLRIFLKDMTLDEMLAKALDIITGTSFLTSEPKGIIFLAGPGGTTLSPAAHKGYATAQLECCQQIPFGRCLCGWAAQTGQMVCADHMGTDRAVSPLGRDAGGPNCLQVIDTGPHGHVCLPLMGKKGEVMGVLNLVVEAERKVRRAERYFLKAVADALSMALVSKNSERDLERTTKTLRHSLRGTVRAIANAVEARDPYTHGHQQRVSDLARAIATEMGLPPEVIDGIRIAGLIHDIGKLSVPSDILNKPGRLIEPEFELIKRHPRAGYDIIKDIDFPWPVGKAILQHHERLDGSGYPSGLKEADIIMEARILAVADVVEATSSHRPYRAALSIDQALEEVLGNKGRLYDSEAAQACQRLFKEKGFQYRFAQIP